MLKSCLGIGMSYCIPCVHMINIGVPEDLVEVFTNSNIEYPLLVMAALLVGLLMIGFFLLITMVSEGVYRIYHKYSSELSHQNLKELPQISYLHFLEPYLIINCIQYSMYYSQEV